jgi:hypothetical protein
MKNENGFTNRYKRVPGTLLLRKKFVQIGISLTHLFHITIVSYCNNLTNRENGSDPENQQIIEAQVTKKTGNLRNVHLLLLCHFVFDLLGTRAVGYFDTGLDGPQLELGFSVWTGCVRRLIKGKSFRTSLDLGCPILVHVVSRL